MDARVVGERIAKLRKSYGMTQKQLADEISVTDKAVSKWETGAGLPDIAILPALASALKTSVDDLIAGPENDEIDNNNSNDDHNNQYNRFKSVRRYVRKPIVLTISSLVVALIALAVIFQNFNKNENIMYDEGIQVHPDASNGFGLTYDHAKTIYDMQIGENIRTQLMQSLFIESAVVIVNSAEASPFRVQENGRETIVSVLLTIADTYTLSDIDIQTIEDLIKSTIPDIKGGNIVISIDM